MHHAIASQVSSDVLEVLVDTAHKQLGAGLDRSEFRNERGETPLQTAVRLAESSKFTKSGFLYPGRKVRSRSEINLNLDISQTQTTPSGTYLDYASILYQMFVDVHDST